MQTRRMAMLAFAAVLAAGGAGSAEISADAVNAASYGGGPVPGGQSPLVVKLQVLLDRAGVSPGVIDGYWGENVEGALRAFERREGLGVDGALDDEVWQRLGGPEAGDVVGAYTVSEEDVAGPFVDEIPDDWAAMAEMDRLAYTSVGEMLAERFHMDLDLFASLNGGLAPAAGATVTVTRPGEPATSSVARIEVSKSGETVQGFDEAGNLVAHYPATVGSETLPSPSGTHEVVAIAPNPNYTFDPENIPEADVDEKLIIPPGPNGPVGSMWIDLSQPTYGLHGTAEPASIGKTASHGCVRLTNWDAEELAERVKQGVPVAFVD